MSLMLDATKWVRDAIQQRAPLMNGFSYGALLEIVQVKGYPLVTAIRLSPAHEGLYRTFVLVYRDGDGKIVWPDPLGVDIARMEYGVARRGRPGGERDAAGRFVSKGPRQMTVWRHVLRRLEEEYAPVLQRKFVEHVAHGRKGVWDLPESVESVNVQEFLRGAWFQDALRGYLPPGVVGS